jgi:hypothetical protein
MTDDDARVWRDRVLNSPTEPTSVRLRRAEQERDVLRDRLRDCEACGRPIDQHIAYCHTVIGPELDRLRDERDFARAELASARKELELLRAHQDSEGSTDV